MNWSINGKTVKSLMKDGKEIVKVERVEDGKILYEKENNNNYYIIVTNTRDSMRLGYGNYQWLGTIGNVIIDWGDGTSDTVNNPTTPLNHTYSDGEENHNITFTGTITSLGRNCFNGQSLTYIKISSPITSIGTTCFAGSKLTSITIPNGVISLGNSSFYNSLSLSSITIPSSVTNIENFCFKNCTALVDYQLYWTGSDILTYDSNKLTTNTNTIFTIPVGETANYIAKGYPSNKLVEKST